MSDESLRLVPALALWVGSLCFLVFSALAVSFLTAGFGPGSAGLRVMLATSRFWAAMRWPLIWASVPFGAGFLVFFHRSPSIPPSKGSVRLDFQQTGDRALSGHPPASSGE